MKLSIKPGRYVLAVSGGVDSIVLLHLLVAKYQIPNTKYQFVVAHFDHGIRKSSNKDRVLVEGLVKQYGLPFEYGVGKLGSKASEETARNARYKFLEEVLKKHKADAIITAHHQDDILETAIINLIRGTGRKGLTSLRSTTKILRPLLGYSKVEIRSYAKAQSLVWMEDETNADTTYLRNHVRHNILPKLTDTQRQKLINLLADLSETNATLDQEIAKYLQIDSAQIDRRLFVDLPHNVATESMAEWLRSNGIRDFTKQTIERLVVAAKTLQPDQRANISKGKFLEIDNKTLKIT